MGIIGRNILQKNTLKRKHVPVPEWEGIIIIRDLTGIEKVHRFPYGLRRR